LLEEERHAGGDALIADVADPRILHRARSRPGLSAHDSPVDAGEIEHLERPEERLDREELDVRPGLPEEVDLWVGSSRLVIIPSLAGICKQ
jgi:hypothetical protein